MTVQIAVRLPDQVVADLDAEVRRGAARSRAELVTRAVRRELRRQRAIDELDRLGEPDPELEAFVRHARRPALDD